MARRYLLEQIDDAAVVQYYADGFEALTLDQKILAWHLAQAAIAGRDIYYDQRYRHALEMREVIEEILTHAAGHRPGDAGRSSPLRQTLLDQLRAAQQHHLAKVRAALQQRRLSRRGRDRRPPRRPFSGAPGRDAGGAARAPRRPVLRPDRGSAGDEQGAGRGPRHPGRQREQPLRRRDDGRPRGVRGASRPELPARQARRAPRRGGVPRQRPLRRADRARSSATSSPPCLMRRPRCGAPSKR